VSELQGLRASLSYLLRACRWYSFSSGYGALQHAADISFWNPPLKALARCICSCNLAASLPYCVIVTLLESRPKKPLIKTIRSMFHMNPRCPLQRQIVERGRVGGAGPQQQVSSLARFPSSMLPPFAHPPFSVPHDADLPSTPACSLQRCNQAHCHDVIAISEWNSRSPAAASS